MMRSFRPARLSHLRASSPVTASKNSMAALQNLCRLCSTIKSPGKSSAAALRGVGTISNALRACSTKLSQWLCPGSHGKSTGKRKPIKKDCGLLKNVRTWTCKICAFNWRARTGKTDYHLQSIHAARYQEIVAETEAWYGASWSFIQGLPKNLLPFSALDIKGLVAKKSKRLHLQTCKRRPKKVPPLRQYHHDRVRKMRGGKKREVGTWWMHGICLVFECCWPI